LKPRLHRALAAAGGFIAGYLALAALTVGVIMAARAGSGSFAQGWLEGLAMAAYFVAIYAVLNGLAYAVLATLSRGWAQRQPRRIMGWSAVAGAVACAAYWSGFTGIALLPLHTLLPARAAVWLGAMLAGLVAGLAVILWARYAPSSRWTNSMM